MTRTDIHLDAMLRHLGAAYYESLHGRANRADVTRALDTIEEHLNEQAPHHASGRPSGTQHAARAHRAGPDTDGRRHHHGWARRVSDVMTTSVVTVDRITPYKEIARLLAEHRISGLPVLKMGHEVAGVVTEADLLTAQEQTVRRLHSATRRTWRPRHGRQHPALTAGELMTGPAITISPNATVPAAARLMNTRHIRRLPVVDSSGRNGIVTLTGTLSPRIDPHGDLIPIAIRLMWGVDGVVDIIDRLGAPRPASAAQATPPAQAD